MLSLDSYVIMVFPCRKRNHKACDKSIYYQNKICNHQFLINGRKRGQSRTDPVLLSDGLRVFDTCQKISSIFRRTLSTHPAVSINKAHGILQNELFLLLVQTQASWLAWFELDALGLTKGHTHKREHCSFYNKTIGLFYQLTGLQSRCFLLIDES